MKFETEFGLGEDSDKSRCPWLHSLCPKRKYVNRFTPEYKYEETGLESIYPIWRRCTKRRFRYYTNVFRFWVRG